MWRSLSRRFLSFFSIILFCEYREKPLFSKYSHHFFHHFVSLPSSTRYVDTSSILTIPWRGSPFPSLGMVAHFQEKIRYICHVFCLLNLVVFAYRLCFTNIVCWCSFLPWNLPSCPIDRREVLLHVARVKTPLQCCWWKYQKIQGKICG